MPRIYKPTSFVQRFWDSPYQVGYDCLFESRCERALDLIIKNRKQGNLKIPYEAVKALRTAVAMKNLESATEFIYHCEEFTKGECRLLINAITALPKAA